MSSAASVPRPVFARRPGASTRPRLIALAAALLAQGAAIGAPETQMPTLTVTATLAEQEARTAPASVTVIDAEEIASRHATDLLDAVRGAAGLALSPRQVGGRKTLALRGLEGKHTLTLIDGRRISASDDVIGHSDYQYGWLPLSAVERIEVIRGPMSALYGSEALGGVINVITRTPSERWHASLAALGMQATQGREGGRSGQASAWLAGPLAKGFGLRASVEAVHADDVARPDDRRFTEIEGRRARNANAVLEWRPAQGQRIEAGITAIDEQRWYDDVVRGSAYRNDYDIDRSQTHLAWSGRFATTQAALRAYRSEIDITNTRTNGVAPTRPQHMQDDVLDGHVAFKLADHRVTLGGELREETLHNAGLVGGQDDATHRAFFVQDEWALAPSFVLTAGLRADRHEYFGAKTSPRAYLVWEASPQWVIKGGFGSAFKAPTLKQISPHYVGAEGPHTFMGNADIRPESSRSFELAADGRVGAWTLRSALYQTEIEDLITYRLLRQEGMRRVYLYDNVDRARIRGAELGASWLAASGLTLSLDLALLDTMDKTSGKALTDRPETSANARADWRAGPWSARLDAQYTGRQTATGGAALPAYTLFNASVGHDLKLDAGYRLRLRAGVDNLGNVRLAQKSADFGYAERPRRLYVQARLEY